MRKTNYAMSMKNHTKMEEGGGPKVEGKNIKGMGEGNLT
jgi:hypothetical protein